MDDLDSLELEVADFGPIVEAKINLRPLTVFVGPSNTGKSYLAILIYALHRHFHSVVSPGYFVLNYDRFPGIGTRIEDRKTIDAVRELLEKVSTPSGKPHGERNIVLNARITKAISSELETAGHGLGNEIGRCFGIGETRGLIRKRNTNGARIVFRKRNSNDFAPIEHELTLKTQTVDFGTTMPKEIPVRINVGNIEESIQYWNRLAEMISKSDIVGEDFDVPELGLIGYFFNLVLSQLVSPLFRPAFYLPADRGGIMHSHRALVSALVQNATTAGLRPDGGIPILSGVLADFLQQLIQLEPQSYRRPESRGDLSTQIEEAILRGSVQVESPQGINYPHFTYLPKGWKDSLPLMNASSMVSELAPVVLYLRYMVGPGSVLIIEEPESHLHPAMQVEFTRQLAALVQAGVRVIVTTHSEWVLEELANIVQRSKLPDARRKEMPRGDFALCPGQVGAWLFKPKRRPKGSVVEEVKLDDEIGLYPTDYDAVSEALYNDSVRISNRIQDSNAE